MATVNNVFNRYLKKDIINSTTTGIIGGSGVPTNTDMTVMGFVVTNTYDSPSNTPITIDVIFKAGATEYFLMRNGRIPEGESLVVIGWDQKLVLKTGDDIIVKTKNASETCDAIMSVLEITTTA
jgi:hypothetical protein